METGRFGVAGFERTLSDAEVRHEFLAFEGALRDLADHPPGDSEALVAFSAAAIHDLHDANFVEFREVVEDFIKDRPETSSAYKVQLFWRTFQYILLNRTTDEQYPQAYTNALTWQTAFRAILIDPPDSLNREGWTVREFLATNNNQTNEPRRYAGIKFAIAAYAKELPESLSMVDAGCSVGLGQIQIGENVPFSGIDLDTDPAIRRVLREKLLAKLVVANNVGFDQVISTDHKWVEANSYYPSELLDSKFNHTRKEFRNYLYQYRSGFVREHADLTDEVNCVPDVLTHNDGHPYDVATALTSLYEIPNNKLPVATKTLESLTDKLVVVQDFACIDPEDPTKLKFTEDLYSQDSKYRLFTKLIGAGEQTWTHLGTWNNGRCTRFRPTAALIERCLDT